MTLFKKVNYKKGLKSIQNRKGTYKKIIKYNKLYQRFYQKKSTKSTIIELINIL